MTAYSQDLRERVAAAVERKEGSLRQLALRFCVSLSFIVRLLQLQRQTGSLQPRPHAGGQPPALDDQAIERLRQLIRDQPDLILDELSQQVGVPCSRMAIWRTLRKLKITRKKKVLYAQEQQKPEVQQKRLDFAKEVTILSPEQLVFVDESGTTTAMARLYGRAPKGRRVVSSVPGYWESLTLITGMRLGGVVAPWVFPGATDTIAFSTYVEEILVPQLRRRDVVIWDNLKPHQAGEVIKAVEAAGAFVLPLPPWSPDLSPLEKLLSKVKGIVRRLVPRCVPALIDALATALRAVCPKDVLGWFQSCGLATEFDDPTAERKPGILELIGYC
jgi:transposase